MLALRVIGLVVLVGVVIARVDGAAVAASFVGVSPAQAALGVLGFSLGMTTRIAKWAWQLRRLQIPYTRGPMVRGFLWGILLGAVTPMRVGEFYRLAVLAAAQRGLAAAALVVEKVYEILALLLLVVIGAFLTLPWPAGLIALIGWGVVAVPALTRLRPPLLPRRLEPFLAARDNLQGRQRLWLLGLTLLAHLCNATGGLQVYRCFGSMEAGTYVFLTPMLTFSSAIPITVSGIGLREIVAMEIFAPTGYPRDAAAVAASLTFLCANILPTLLVLPLEGLRALRSGVVR